MRIRYRERGRHIIDLPGPDVFINRSKVRPTSWGLTWKLPLIGRISWNLTRRRGSVNTPGPGSFEVSPDSKPRRRR